MGEVENIIVALSKKLNGEVKLKCNKCGTDEIYKKGFHRNGRQRYFCKICRKRFTPIDVVEDISKAKSIVYEILNMHKGGSKLKTTREVVKARYGFYIENSLYDEILIAN